MKVGKFISNYLKANSIKEDAPVDVTISAVKEEEIGREDNKEDKLVIYFKEIEQGLVANKTIVKTLVKLTGSDDSQDWIGKQFTLFHDPNVFYQGAPVGGLRLRTRT